jgi:hypothetical protein
MWRSRILRPIVLALLILCEANAAAEPVNSDAVGQQQNSNGWTSPATEFDQIDPNLLDQPAETPMIHGYAEAPFKTAHITPRGLVIADKGVEFQPSGALRFDLYDGTGLLNNATFTTGLWNSINSSLKNHDVGGWFEADYFAKFSFVIDQRIDFTTQYISFISPEDSFVTDHNIETTLAFDDKDLFVQDFTFHPYTRVFYNISGSSTTILGRNGSTYDVEFGAEPAYTLKTFDRYPITFSLPTYVTVGPGNFWGDSTNFGVFTSKFDAKVPLSFIPARFGYWHADTSVSYFNLLNPNLVQAAKSLGNAANRNWVVGEVGIGVEF